MSSKAVKVTAAGTPKPRDVAEFISWQINLCGKSQVQIAQEVGFDKPNVITMIKQGKTKVPINKIASMAKSLEVDPVYFLKLCIEEYMPDMMEVITTITGQPTISSNELEFIEIIRSADVPNPKIRNDDERRALLDFINSLQTDNQSK